MWESFGQEIAESNYSTEFKMGVLGVTKKDELVLQSLPCTNITVSEEENSIIKEINLTDVVGFNRASSNENNWLECLNSLHNTNIFRRFKGKEQFSELLNCKDRKDLPIVTEYQEKYYISGDGRHRLTIGKCIGIETAVVAVHKAQKEYNAY